MNLSEDEEVTALAREGHYNHRQCKANTRAKYLSSIHAYSIRMHADGVYTARAYIHTESCIVLYVYTYTYIFVYSSARSRTKPELGDKSTWQY